MNKEKQSRRSAQWALIFSIVAVLAVVALRANTSPPTNRAETTPDHEDEALRSRFYDVSLPNAISAVQQALRAQKTYGRGWKITGYDSTTSQSQRIHAEVPVIIFVDDFAVTLKRQSDGGTRVDCLSASRVGKGDFGENRRHIIQFLDALDEALKK
jgi:hypothetical protein